MNDLTPLNRLIQSQIKIDPQPKTCPSDGFEYPTFRQLNKYARVYLSTPLELHSAIKYNLFDVANSKGWFVAVKHSSSGSDLLFSTLEDLRSSFASAKGSPEELFTAKRTLSTPSRANIVRFAAQDSRLVVAQDNGSLLLFDTSQLFTEDAIDVHPITSAHIQTTSLSQIVPNPGTEPGLSELIAVVSNGKVQLLDTRLEPQGGWTATDLMTQPIAVSWSPKGKHIAIGLQTGDILTFAPTNKTTPHKHIPPTADGILVSLNWLGPGHTFRTSYAPQGSASPLQHVIVLDTRTSSATYFAPEHPFPTRDRNFQTAYTLNFPKWDTESSSNDENKYLTIAGDACSTDLEILGNIGSSWFRQVQENPLQLPMDAADEDTIIVALECDLTDSAAGAPIMYAYLNDGSLQGWHLEHSKPYLGLISSKTPGPSAEQASSHATNTAKDTDMSADETPLSNAFSQQKATTNAFGQSSFAQQSSSAFGSQQISGFGQTGFATKPQETSAFGQTLFSQQPAYGNSGFGPTSAFSQPNQTETPSAFSSIKPATGFGAFGGSNNAFGSSSSSGAFGSATTSAFSNLNSGVTNAFGQGSFGSAQPTNTPSDSMGMTREASMSDSTPSLSGFGLGSATPADPNARNSMFGTFSTTPIAAADQGSAFGSGSLVKPATGFGAFSSYKPSSTFEAPKPSTTSAFASPPQTTNTSGFGQSGFANPAFGKPAFGQPAFGKPSLGAPATTPSTTTSGAFSAFASTPTAFSSGASPSAVSPGSGAFGAYATTTNAFAAASSGTPASENKPAIGGGFSAFANNGLSPFGSTSTTASKPSGSGAAFSAFASSTPLAFGATAQPSEAAKENPKVSSSTSSPFAASSTSALDAAPRTSVFSAPTGSSAATTSIFATPSRSSSFANNEDSPEQASPPSSPEPQHSPGIRSATTSFTPSSTPNAFSNIQSTPSSFKPASGFGAFGSFGGPNPDSPFYKKPTEILPPTSVFALASSPKTPTNLSSAPTFGSTSALGAVRSAFAPINPPSETPTRSPATATNAFSAFSGASSSFSAYVSKKSSFSDLLKTGGEEAKDPVKTPALPLSAAANEKKKVSVFGSPATSSKKESTPPISAFAPIPKDTENEIEKKKAVSDEPSYGNLSISSNSSSFVDVTRDEKEEGEYTDEEPDEDAEHSGDDDESTNSFLSGNYSDSYQEEFPEDEEGSDREEIGLPDIEEEAEDEEETLSIPSRSPSPTPQPETPSIKVSLPPDEDGEQSTQSQVPQERGKSVTPPDSPVRESDLPLIPPPTTPVANSAQSSKGIGLGRPSTRPTRSSPLANTISGSDDEDEQKNPVAPIPVSPKVLPVKLEDTTDETTLKRPKTPPLLSVLGGKSPTGSISSLPPVAATPKTLPYKLTPSVKSEPAASSGLEALASAAATSPPSVVGKATDKQPQSIFGRPTTVPPSQPALKPSSAFDSSQPSLFGSSLFSLKNATAATAATAAPSIKSPTLPPMPSFGGFPSPIPRTPTPSSGGFSSSPKPSPPSTMKGGIPSTPKSQNGSAQGSPGSPGESTAALEEGMQKECMRLVIAMQLDLKQVSMSSQVAAKTLADLSSQIGGSRHRADLGNQTKWTLNDLEQFAQLLKQYEVELDLFEANKEKDEQTFREIQSNMLKAGTRREEIARFNKAKDDKDFAKMLRSRTLGPEYSETQAQLRKSIRDIRDRIQKLENHLVEDKKKLAQSTSLKPSFRAPSLDTINRTYRNIEIAIDQQSSEVARLASRLGKLNLKEAAQARSRDSRLPDAGNRQPYDITPNVAVTTAAALNAERAASRLKKALLCVRSEPLLNTKASSAPSAPVAFVTPKKAPTSGPSLFSEALTLDAIPDWDIPPDNFDPSGSPSPSAHRGGGKAKKHQPFKRNPAPVAATAAAVPPPPGFEWGPLPSFSTPPPQPTFSFTSFVKK